MSDAALRDSASLRPGIGAVETRYTTTAMALHWLTAVLIFAVLPLAWVAVSLPDSSGSQELMFTLHKSVGLTIVALIAARLAWRVLHPPPPETRTPRGLAAIGVASHWLLYAIFVIMPVSGYLLSSGEPYPLTYFGLFDVPKAPMSKEGAEIAERIHLVGQWAVYLLVVLHLLATAWHAAIRRDGVIDRMVPLQDG